MYLEFIDCVQRIYLTGIQLTTLTCAFAFMARFFGGYALIMLCIQYNLVGMKLSSLNCSKLIISKTVRHHDIVDYVWRLCGSEGAS